MSTTVATLPTSALPQATDVVPASAPLPVLPTTAPRPLPELYYLPKSKCFFRRNDQGRWFELNTSSASNWLVMQGYSPVKPDNSHLSPVDECLVDIQSRQCIDYAGPLAGHDAGHYSMNGHNILVVNSPQFIEPVPGNWPVLGQILERMLVDGDRDQRPFYYGWMKMGLTSFRQRRWQPAQILVLAGPARSGKSLLLNLHQLLFGGRQESPYQYLTGATSFNGEMFGAEHLVIDDESEARDLQSRREMGAKLKQLAVSKSHRCHAKYVQGLTLEPRWRVSIALNDEPERLMVLPPLDPDIADKIMLLRVLPGEMPMPTETTEQQEEFWRTLVAELPAFVDFLLHYEIPEAVRGPRFGVTAFHHPSLVELINEKKREQLMLELLDQIAPWNDLDDGALGWSGTASQLTAILHNHVEYGSQGRGVVANAVQCGTYLTRLLQANEPRVSVKKVHNVSHYTVLAPPQRARNRSLAIGFACLPTDTRRRDQLPPPPQLSAN